ncbi:MAG: RDD family protein [Mariprofundus sp.]|nr:RDD family protein [Mariprofundus sp.]
MDKRLQGVKAGILIRILASVYDGLILFGLCYLAFIPLTIAERSLGETPHWLKGALIVAISFAYFVGFWAKGGATTGMRPWKLRVAMQGSGDPISWATASVRYAVLMLTWLALGMTLWYLMTRDTGHFLFYLASAIPALSMLVMLISTERSSLHDLISSTGVYKISVD